MTLDRISMGRFENNDPDKVLDDRGRASFKLCSDVNYHYIIGRLTKGGIVSSGNLFHIKEPSKQEFLSEVNNDLSQIDCYLGEAKYSKGFPIFGSHRVKGILYKEYKRNPGAKRSR